MQCVDGRLCLLFVVFALAEGELKVLNLLALFMVSLEQFLVLHLVLVWHHFLAWHRGVTEELSCGWGVVLYLLLLCTLETSRLLNLDRQCLGLSKH